MCGYPLIPIKRIALVPQALAALIKLNGQVWVNPLENSTDLELSPSGHGLVKKDSRVDL